MLFNSFNIFVLHGCILFFLSPPGGRGGPPAEHGGGPRFVRGDRDEDPARLLLADEGLRAEGAGAGGPAGVEGP